MFSTSVCSVFCDLLPNQSVHDRFDSTLSVVLSAKDKFKKIGRELQLPSMQVLTNKTSHQASSLSQVLAKCVIKEIRLVSLKRNAVPLKLRWMVGVLNFR